MYMAFECVQAHVAAPIRRVERFMAWVGLPSDGKV